MEEDEPKISGIEAMLMLGVCLFFDGMDIVATFLNILFGGGEIIKIFINAIAFPILFLWVKLKGVGTLSMVAGNIMEFIPLVNTLPIRTITMAIVIWLDRHPQETELLSRVKKNTSP